MLIRHDPTGAFTLPAKSYVTIPAAVRARCEMRTGDRVLLAAASQHATLLVYTTALLHQLLTQHHPGLPGCEL